MRVIDTFRTVLSLAYSPCGRFLYSAGWQHVSRWDVFSSEEDVLFDTAGTGYLQSVAVSPDGRNVGWVQVVGRLLHTDHIPPVQLSCQPMLGSMGSWGMLHDQLPVLHSDRLVAAPTGRAIAFVQDRALRLAAMPDTLPRPTSTHSRRLEKLPYSFVRQVSGNPGHWFGFASDAILWWHENSDLLIEDITTFATTRIASPERLPLAVTPDGRTGIAASAREVLLIDLPSGLTRERFNWDVGTVEAVAVAPDGMTAAASGWAGGIAIFDLDG